MSVTETMQIVEEHIRRDVRRIYGDRPELVVTVESDRVDADECFGMAEMSHVVKLYRYDKTDSVFNDFVIYGESAVLVRLALHRLLGHRLPAPESEDEEDVIYRTESGRIYSELTRQHTGCHYEVELSELDPEPTRAACDTIQLDREALRERIDAEGEVA